LTATLEASPKSFSGSCPARITFRGKITLAVSQPGVIVWRVEVKYRFKRSDGAIDTNIKTVTFGKPGSEDVTETWTLGGPAGFPFYCNWESIEIISPQKVESNQAPFLLECSNAPPPNLQITDMFSEPLGNNSCDIGFKVKNMGGQLGSDNPTFCTTTYMLSGTACNSSQQCMSMAAPVGNGLRSPGGEQTYSHYIPAGIIDFSKSPFTLKLQLARRIVFQGGQHAWTGNQFSLTKGLKCP
jgi:hypothetical protein